MRIQTTVLDALQKTEELLPDALAYVPYGYTLSTPSSSDIKEAAGWTLNWSQNYEAWLRDDKRIGVAIRCDGVLCGLGLGKFHKKMGYVGITMIEGNPDPGHPFKGLVLDTVELLGIICAQKVGASEVRLFNPVESVIPYYLESGFELVPGNPPYCVKQV